MVRRVESGQAVWPCPCWYPVRGTLHMVAGSHVGRVPLAWQRAHGRLSPQEAQGGPFSSSPLRRLWLLALSLPDQSGRNHINCAQGQKYPEVCKAQASGPGTCSSPFRSHTQSNLLLYRKTYCYFTFVFHKTVPPKCGSIRPRKTWVYPERHTRRGQRKRGDAKVGVLCTKLKAENDFCF